MSDINNVDLTDVVLAKGDTLQLSDAIQITFTGLYKGRPEFHLTASNMLDISKSNAYGKGISNGSIIKEGSDRQLSSLFNYANIKDFSHMKGFYQNIGLGQRLTVHPRDTMAGVIIEVADFDSSDVQLEISMPGDIPVYVV